MASLKMWIALAVVAVVVLAGAAFALNRSGDGPKAATTSENVPAGQAGGTASTASPEASAQQVQEMLQSITSQLAQAANNGGQPRAVTSEEVQAILRQQQQQLGIK